MIVPGSGHDVEDDRDGQQDGPFWTGLLALLATGGEAQPWAKEQMSMPADQSLDSATRLLATSPEPAFVVDLGGRIVYWNHAADVFFGIPASEAVGRPCAMVVRGLSEVGEILCTRNCPLLARASQDDSYSVAEMRIPTMPRPARWSRKRVHHLPLEDDSGETGYVIHVVTDVPGDPEQARPSLR